MNFKFLIDYIVIEDGLIKLSDIEIKDMKHAKEMVTNIEKLFLDLSVFNYKGYINDPHLNIPVVDYLIRNIINPKDSKHFVASITLNTLYFNLLLLLMKRLVISINDWLLNSELELDHDLLIDVKSLRYNIKRMINPCLINKLQNKGISIMLTTITGYDSEYELRSSLEMTNDLLSVQLATNTSFYVKVPIIDIETLNVEDFNLADKPLWHETKKIKQCCDSIVNAVKCIRIIYSENDVLLNKLRTELESIEHITKWVFNGFILYTYPKTSVETSIKYVSEYSSNDLIKDSECMKEYEYFTSLLLFMKLLNKITDKEEISSKMLKSIKNSINKPKSRITFKFNDNKSKLTININRTLYICMHESAADLSMLKDFDSFKEYLDIVDRSFVTRGKPLDLKYNKSKVYIRDTILLAPQGAKSLASIGDILGSDFKKVDIGKYRNGRLKDLLSVNKDLFEEYALRDSIITHKYAVNMEEFNLTVDKIGVPLTLSGIAKSYVIKGWGKELYKGYQVRNDIMIGNLMNKITPRDARGIELSKYLISYIAGYRGGRNESMMYGIDSISNGDRSWFDYDLTSCYTTVMSILGHPDVDKAARIFNKTVVQMSNKDLLFNYIVLDVDFTFSKDTKYPCIPCRVDDNIDIYPLKGTSIITGSEYLVAKSMGCRLFVKDGILIPFKNDVNSKSKNIYKSDEWITWNALVNDFIIDPNKISFELFRSEYDFIVGEWYNKNRDRSLMELLEERKCNELKPIVSDNDTDNKNEVSEMYYNEDRNSNAIYNYNYNYVLDYKAPFRGIIKGLQVKRLNYPKKTFFNYMYKEIGNSIYGQVAMGVSGNNNFDIKSQNYVRIEGGILSNPILSSYITGFCRALIGECMHNIQLLGGNIVSVTTDGFITDVKDLESKLMSLNNENLNCLYLYRSIRKLLTDFEGHESDERALEIKNEETKGLISWKTRGQLGYTNGGISAATGFQTKYYEKDFLIHEFTKYMNDDEINNVIEYVQCGLRSAKDIYKYGGNVIKKYKDRKFSLDYDNKRRILDKDSNLSFSNLLDSSPWNNVKEYGKIRLLREIVNSPVYIDKSYSNQPTKSYKSYIETAVRNFIKACLSENEINRYGIPIGVLVKYKDIIDFIHGFEPAREVKLSKSSISHLKGRNTITRAVPRTKETECFIRYVKDNFEMFEDDRFFREYSESFIKNRIKTRMDERVVINAISK